MPGAALTTQVAIVGAGPAGSLLAVMLHHAGIESVVIERQSREHVLSRIRAGVLEWGTVEVLRANGLGARMDAEGHIHTETGIAYGGEHLFYFDIGRYAHTQFMSYGQTMIQEDLYNAADRLGLTILFEVDDVALRDVTGDRPTVVFTHDGQQKRIDCEFVVGCDGFHGPAKSAIPPSVLRTYEKAYPFGWLGIMSRDAAARAHRVLQQPTRLRARVAAQPDAEPLLRAVPARRHRRRLARRAVLGGVARPLPRPGVVADRDRPVDREVDRSPAQLRRRADAIRQPVPGRRRRPHRAADRRQGPQPRRVRRVLPVARARHHYNEHDDHYLDCYSDMALRRVWAAVRFSWWLTSLLHRFPEQTAIDQRLQEAELAHLHHSEKAQAAISEQYAGMPFES